jgi:amino acid transporter
MSHLAESRLLPEVFKHVHSSGTPYIAILVGTAMSYAICLLAHFIPILEKTLMNVCILWSFLTHASQCIGFVKMRTRFQNLNRSFSSPLGVTGAYYALFIYIFGSISLIGFQDDNFLALIILVVVGIVLSLYYFGYAISRQTFSEQERKIMFVAHVINCEYDDPTLLVCSLLRYR